jgi:hypothetical protein
VCHSGIGAASGQGLQTFSPQSRLSEDIGLSMAHVAGDREVRGVERWREEVGVGPFPPGERGDRMAYLCPPRLWLRLVGSRWTVEDDLLPHLPVFSGLSHVASF